MNILRIICEEYQRLYENINSNDWYVDDDESIADKMYAKFGISANQQQSQEPPSTTKGKYIGSFYRESYPGIPMAVYLNPKNLSEFNPSVRAVLMQNGDLYVCANNKGYHEDILILLAKLNIVPINSQNVYYIKDHMPKEFIAIRRIGRSDTFEPSEILDFIQPEHFLNILSLGNEKQPYQFVINGVEVMKGYYDRIYPMHKYSGLLF